MRGQDDGTLLQKVLDIVEGSEERDIGIYIYDLLCASRQYALKHRPFHSRAQLDDVMPEDPGLRGGNIKLPDPDDMVEHFFFDIEMKPGRFPVR
jgi:hypothetical protein